MPIQVTHVSPESSILHEIIELGDRNSKYVGHFPNSCFVREAAKKRILAAVDEASHLLGYVLYRTNRRWATIQQLCVDEKARGVGVARLLVNHLKTTTSHLDGIVLHCARDFPAHGMWIKLGFVPVGHKLGRGQFERYLTRFLLDYHRPDLFSRSREESAATRLLVAIDANIAIDLQDQEHEDTALESLALTADWLQEEIDLRLTDEYFNEIERLSCPKERERRRQFARSFPKLDEDREKCNAIADKLAQIISPGTRASGHSDVRQLAAAIAGGATVFLSHDRDLCSRAQTIIEPFGLEVMKPSDLIIRLDELQRAHAYAPSRLAGSPLSQRLVSESDIADILRLFLATGKGERRGDFGQTIRTCLAAAPRTEVVLFEQNDRPIALIALDHCNDATSIVVLRVLRCAVAETLLRHMLLIAIRKAVQRRCPIVVVSDSCSLIQPDSALSDLGFLHADESWIKVCPVGAWTEAQATAFIQQLAGSNRYIQQLEDCILSYVKMACQDDLSCAAAEHVLWPAKLLTGQLPNFIVPIRPRWATQLFDEELASGQLIHTDPHLVLNFENVYYRSSHHRIPTVPSRILWYVSKDRGDTVQCIRACSPAFDDDIGEPKELYRKYRRLGVYSFRDLREIADKSRRGTLLSIRFGPTESLPCSIPRKRVKTILAAAGYAEPPLSMPYRISEECFAEIYRLSMGEQG